MKVEDRNLNGYIPSGKDKLDYTLDMYNISYTEKPKAHKITDIPKVIDQDNTGMCVAFGLSNFLARFQYKELGEWLDFSQGFIYSQKAFKEWEGMIPRYALGRVKDMGDVLADTFNVADDVEVVLENYNNFIDNIGIDNVLEMSKPNRFESFARLSGIDEIKTALLDDRMVGAGIKVRYKFYHTDDGFIAYDESDKIYGGHWINVIGFDDEKRALLIQNTWGEDWGDNGFAWLSYDYPIEEAWTVFDYVPDIPRNSKESMELKLNDKNAVINGNDIELRVAPFFKQYSNKYSALCTELKPIFENLGYTVNWDSENKKVSIYK